eukprot:CAMPEP_0117010484 /NCGR_PEP_ID=MMETSP0472-20121206/9229_1 /TAXON_ID=693140 ORGANISM="Tiarina fusus, Strain LIS" /NCGR_SAMPLE_ID=MMETSP0472 /ASSEMBLY_ACC=CAM_ASM_000603 /LENGTH=220 /DNA_ID=CAMNT_0004713029 /DNA_START=178 /DNA_END=840 /DNA_ORIENTATION=-
MTTYSNYQLPNNNMMYGQYPTQYPTPVSQFSSSAPPQQTYSHELVPSYGPPPTSSMPAPAPAPQLQSKEELEIIAAQERAWELAKSGRTSSSTSPASSTSSSSSSSRQMVPHNANSNNSMIIPKIKVDHKNRPVTESIHPQKYQMKKLRKNKTMAGVAGGAVVGTIFGGPVGTVVGGAAGGYAANKISKRGERRAQRHHERDTYQRAAQASKVAQHAAFA